MKNTINIILLLIYIILNLSCNSTHKIEINNDSIFLQFKKVGIILRMSANSKISKEEIANNTLYWLSNYQLKENVSLITNVSDDLIYFKYPQQKFYQISNENKYLKYKSIGVVNVYLQNNSNEISNIIAKQNLDCIVIFEVYCIISCEMNFLSYDTVLVVADNNLNIAYLDHNTTHFDSESNNLKLLKNQLLDKLDERLMESLQSLELLGPKRSYDDEKSVKSAGKPGNESEEMKAKIITPESKDEEYPPE